MIRLVEMNSDELLMYHALDYARSFTCDVTGAEVGRRFEEGFYERILREPSFRLLSRSYDLGMGHQLNTTSGVRHETDAVLTDGLNLYVCELKHYFESQIDKNMLLIFNHKVIDFYLELIRKGRDVRIKRLFLTRCRRLDNFTREFAMSWGIGIVDGELWPPHLLKVQMRDYVEEFGDDAIGKEWWVVVDDLCEKSFRDISDIMVPYSPMQVTIDSNKLLGPDECMRLVENHHGLFDYLGEFHKCHL